MQKMGYRSDLLIPRPSPPELEFIREGDLFYSPHQKVSFPFTSSSLLPVYRLVNWFVYGGADHDLALVVHVGLKNADG